MLRGRLEAGGSRAVLAGEEVRERPSGGLDPLPVYDLLVRQHVDEPPLSICVRGRPEAAMMAGDSAGNRAFFECHAELALNSHRRDTAVVRNEKVGEGCDRPMITEGWARSDGDRRRAALPCRGSSR